MKKMMLAGIMIALMIPAFVFGTEQVEPKGKLIKIFDEETINATATVSALPTNLGTTFGYVGVWYQAVSTAGTPNIDIDFKVSYDQTAANFVRPEGESLLVDDLADETPHVDNIQIPAMPYIKIVATGNATNPADTVLTLYLFVQ